MHKYKKARRQDDLQAKPSRKQHASMSSAYSEFNDIVKLKKSKGNKGSSAGTCAHHNYFTASEQFQNKAREVFDSIDFDKRCVPAPR